MIFEEQPTDPWKHFDFKLIEAYQILQDETCPSCGQPIWICHSTDDRIRFRMRNHTCFADQYQKKWEKQKSHGKKDGWQPAPGVQWYAEPYMQGDETEPFPSRDDYYRSLVQ